MTEAAPRQRKKILVVSAHPEPRSLNATLTSFAVEHLRAAGHEVRVSDLYAMKWKATVDADDFPEHTADRRLQVMAVSEQATLAGVDQTLKLDDRVVDGALTFQGPGDEVAPTKSQLVLRSSGRPLHGLAGLGLGLDVLAGLGPVEVQKTIAY